MIKCIIFDCDGVLVDSEYLGNVALAMILAEAGVQADPSELTERYRGWKLARIFADLAVVYQVQLDKADYRQTTATLFEKELQAVPGIVDVLSTIKQAKCVASGAPPEKLTQTLGITNLKRFLAKMSIVRIPSRAGNLILACFCMLPKPWGMNQKIVWLLKIARSASKLLNVLACEPFGTPQTGRWRRLKGL